MPLIAVVGSCLGPTEIRLSITSNACDTLKSVEVYVGGSSLPLGASAATQGCTNKSSPNGDVGSIVIVPSGANDENVHINVVGSLVAGACTGPTASGQNCIVARRALSFSPHTPLDVPIFLDSACAGQCTDSGQTCVVIAGVPTCKSETCDNDGGVSCRTDAGPPTEDASFTDTLPVDATPLVCTNDADAGKPAFIWSAFGNSTDASVHEDNDAVIPQPLSSGTTQTAYMPACGNSLHVKSSQLLAVQAPALAYASFTVAFVFRALSLDTPILSLVGPTSSQFEAGFIVSLSGGVLQVSFGTGLAYTVGFADNIPIDLVAPHTFVMHVEASDAGLSSLIEVWRDGKTIAQKNNVVYKAAGDTLTVGAVEWIDELAFYK